MNTNNSIFMQQQQQQQLNNQQIQGSEQTFTDTKDISSIGNNDTPTSHVDIERSREFWPIYGFRCFKNVQYQY